MYLVLRRQRDRIPDRLKLAGSDHNAGKISKIKAAPEKVRIDGRFWVSFWKPVLPML